MRRVHLFEFNERSECPAVIRESLVEILGLGLRWGRIYDAAGLLFADFCRRAEVESVIDLCSGSGEPVSILLESLSRQGIAAPRFFLSDLFPNIAAMERIAARHGNQVEPIRAPIDATAVPARFDRSARTVISALHHFSPDLVRRMLADTVSRRQAIFILECFTRDFRDVLALLPIMGLAMLANPLVNRRQRLLRAMLTLPLPLIPLTGLWDMAISGLRIHTESELRAITDSLANDYAWEYHELPFFPGGTAVAFLGLPRTRSSGPAVDAV